MAERRDQGSGTRDPDTSTDNIELSSVAGRTEVWDSPEDGVAQTALAPAVEANLIVIAHPENKLLGTRFRLSPGATVEVGRSPTAEISLPEVLSVSRRHAKLRYEHDVVTLEDLHSTNGTFVNDQPLAGKRVLESGDRFQVGAVHFKFLHELDVEDAYHRTIHQLVVQDGLTEVFNKRKFEEELEREFSRSQRYRRPLALIVFDIDFFKGINDELGHLCGDFVLKQIPVLLREALRPEQIMARVGGDEFVILCPETGSEGAATLAEKLRERISRHAFRYGGVSVQVSCCFGVAERRRRMERPGDLYSAADRALYTSKKEGRNRVSVADPAGNG